MLRLTKSIVVVSCVRTPKTCRPFDNKTKRFKTKRGTACYCRLVTGHCEGEPSRGHIWTWHTQWRLLSTLPTIFGTISVHTIGLHLDILNAGPVVSDNKHVRFNEIDIVFCVWSFKEMSMLLLCSVYLMLAK